MNIIKNKLPKVVLFGRTNVGKSTLFNKLTEKNHALVSTIEGTTRDSNVGLVLWQGREFEVIDTGGIIKPSDLGNTKAKIEDIQGKIQKQSYRHLLEADLILFMVDSRVGLLPQDREMALFLKKHFDTKKIMLVANKVDGPAILPRSAEFNKLALGKVYPLSAANGSGTGDLLDAVHKKIKTKKIKDLPDNKDEIKVCILGKPNVGKSSLLNSIIGEDRVIVSPIPHTTREPQDMLLNFDGQTIKLIDTAGISRKGQQSPRKKTDKKNALEKFGIAKSLAVLGRANIALLVIDINEPITHQETKIITEIVKRKKSIVLIANKWDLIEEKDTKKFTHYIYAKLPFITWTPLLFVSALTGAKVNKVLELICEIDKARKQRLSDSELNRFLNRIVKIHKPTRAKGVKHPRIYTIKQTYIDPPEFTLRIGTNDTIHDSYLRFIENRIRDRYNFTGTPITVHVTKRRPPQETK